LLCTTEKLLSERRSEGVVAWPTCSVLKVAVSALRSACSSYS
jgi:hypothetical protein